MSSLVWLCTEQPSFEPIWRPLCEQAGLEVRTVPPSEVADSIERGRGVIFDATAANHDEDELLASVGYARAAGAVVGVHLRPDGPLGALEELLDDVCNGLLARRPEDVARVSAAIGRRLDRERGTRFEYVTVSPLGDDLLAMLSDGRCALLRRPLNEEDDGTPVDTIELAEDARSATLRLESGHALRLSAVDAAGVMVGEGPANGATANAPIDGTRLGARLRELRVAAGLTQAELARRTGIHRPNIARVEAGRHTPSLETLARLAKAIGVAPTRVLTED
jgi:DNA-binding XRE family transcriptional regulator